jgi:hypothetical protein
VPKLRQSREQAVQRQPRNEHSSRSWNLHSLAAIISKHLYLLGKHRRKSVRGHLLHTCENRVDYGPASLHTTRPGHYTRSSAPRTRYTRAMSLLSQCKAQTDPAAPYRRLRKGSSLPAVPRIVAPHSPELGLAGERSRQIRCPLQRWKSLWPKCTLYSPFKVGSPGRHRRHRWQRIVRPGAATIANGTLSVKVELLGGLQI